MPGTMGIHSSSGPPGRAEQLGKASARHQVQGLSYPTEIPKP